MLDEALARAEQLGLLYDAGLTLNRTLDPRVQLELLCTIATKALHSDNTSFFLYDAAQNDLHLEFGVGLVQEKESMRVKRFPLGVERGLVGWVAQNRAPLYLSDVTADPRWIVTDPEIRSALWVPVLHDEQLLGVLSASSTRVNAFTSQDEHLFVLFSNQVAVAMENARLFDETRRRLAELEAVSRISSALRSAETFDEMLPRILDEALAVLNSAAGSLILYDPTSKDLRESVSRGWFTDLNSSSLRASEGIAGHVFTTGEMHLAREFAQDPLMQPSALPALPAGQGGACVPIRSTQEIVGVLFVSVALPRELTASEAHLLTTLAEIAGNAIQRMRLHEKTQRDARRFAALHSIDIAISSSLELSDTLNLLLEQVVDLLNVDAADVLLLNPITSTLEYSAGRGFRS
ncbi:MAG: GAF domain-containing protein, partial [Anaerolineales bacterium]|nr:GAF domain-containing protein [Anaerolineales bacterium]